MTEPNDDARAATLTFARMARMLERTLQHHAPLSLSDYRILSAVADGEARASRLAQRLAVGKPSVSASVDSLVRRGLLARAGGAGDQRAIDLRITAEGDRVRFDAERALVALVTEVAEHTSEPTATMAAIAAFGAALEERQAQIHPTGRRA
ncbi:MarR family transcriptional regulator [Microbacterium protaetiae]|uniref:MarR family transcriptional regulator n=1 Tax=Microbacterium protaetiae TaxID=2509458 RepID=A0A4P6EFF2_9MICO|nr:MarR family winged helix-turn-helix transcriptional regulator [Microbacterium protaetiae]QAY61015.1 MarR family transcriptional regulator [Microbacterium protaetiae]